MEEVVFLWRNPGPVTSPGQIDATLKSVPLAAAQTAFSAMVFPRASHSYKIKYNIVADVQIAKFSKVKDRSVYVTFLSVQRLSSLHQLSSTRTGVEKTTRGGCRLQTQARSEEVKTNLFTEGVRMLASTTFVATAASFSAMCFCKPLKEKSASGTF